MGPMTRARVSAASDSRTPQDVSFLRRDLLALGDLDAGEIRALLHETARFAPIANKTDKPLDVLKGRTVATMFLEDSTRTRTSFTLAARRLGADVIDLSGSSSSISKGESLIDTVRTIEAMGIDALVVRAKPNGAAELVAKHAGCPVINAGDGCHEHPTQGLIDCFALAESQGRLETFDLSGLRVLIVGDVAHSRVARSAVAGMTKLGAQVTCVGTPALAPKSLSALGCGVSHDLDSLLAEADGVMMLRVQFERNASIASAREYRAACGLTRERAGRMKPGAVVMHPGPMNRGLEIDGDVADSERSVVLRQVSVGVAVRMAALKLCTDNART